MLSSGAVSAILFTLAAMTSGCATASDGSGTSEDAIVSSPGALKLYEQAPLAVQIGQGVAVADGNATLLPAACVGGTPSSEVDSMKAVGSGGFGATVSSSSGLTTTGPGFSDPRSSVRSKVGGQLQSDTGLTLAEVARFDAAIAPTDLRVAGLAEIQIAHNEFFFNDEARTAASSADCGSMFLHSFKAKRFLSFAFVIDFATDAERNAFRGTANDLLAPRPDTFAFLRSHGAKVSAHVLYSIGLGDVVKASIENDQCDENHLPGCKPMFDHLFAVLDKVSTLPGSDDTAEQLLAPGATWGAYDVDFGTYTKFR